MSDRQNLSHPLDVGFAAEEPDLEIDDIDADQQFLEPGAEEGLGDEGVNVLADFDQGFGDTLSAEEAAMRVVDEPPGMNYDPDPGYIDHDRE